MQSEWAHRLKERTILFAPLCVAEQTIREAQKLSIPIHYARTQGECRQGLNITNYERLEHFDPSQFGAVVLDESSILKSMDGKTRTKLITMFAGTKYRLCCTATPSPNDIAELANHAEFLGLMTRAEFLATWFVHDDTGWRMKKHAVRDFYRWVASWAIALRRPSDLGYADDGFALPALEIHDRITESGENLTGALFPEAGLKGIQGRLGARRGSLETRVAAAVNLVTGEPHEPWILWCGLNEESDALADAIPDSVNVKGQDSYAEKTAAVTGFLAGDIRVLITKPKILGFGMNFQHCARVGFVGLGDSYEAYYQSIRRVWRFGQRRAVQVYLIVSDAERMVVANVRRKEAAAASLADGLLEHLRDFEREELAS
jgi:hypothetical protein